jgi:hypothetical protein
MVKEFFHRVGLRYENSLLQKLFSRYKVGELGLKQLKISVLRQEQLPLKFLEIKRLFLFMEFNKKMYICIA